MNTNKNNSLKKKPLQSFKRKKNNSTIVNLNDEPKYLIQKILDKRVIKGKTQYRIKWQGYDEQKDITWQPAINIPKQAIKQYEEQANKKLNQEQLNSQSSQQILITKNLKKKVKNFSQQNQQAFIKNQNTNQKKSMKAISQNGKNLQPNQGQQGLKGLKTCMNETNRISRRPKIIVPQSSKSLSSIEQDGSQQINVNQHQQINNSQSQDQKNQNQSVKNPQKNAHSQAKLSTRKLKHLRSHSHQTSMKKNEKKKRKKRKLNQFSSDQQQKRTQNKSRINQQKIPYPDKIQHPYQYPNHQKVDFQRSNLDYISFIQSDLIHLNSSAEYQQRISISDSEDDDQSYHTQRSQRGIPQDTIKKIIEKIECPSSKQTVYKCQLFDTTAVKMKQSYLKRISRKDNQIIRTNDKEAKKIDRKQQTKGRERGRGKKRLTEQ